MQTLRAGLLIKELNDNIRQHIAISSSDTSNNTHQQLPKVYIYSTHDTKIALLLHAFGQFNGYLIPAGATLLLELHHYQDQEGSTSNTAKTDSHKYYNKYFLRVYYFNETYTNDWAYQLVSDRICVHISSDSNNNADAGDSNNNDPDYWPQWKCPVKHYLEQISSYEPYDWHYQCGLKMLTLNYFTVNLYILGTNFFCLLILLVLLKLYSSKIRFHC